MDFVKIHRKPDFCRAKGFIVAQSYINGVPRAHCRPRPRQDGATASSTLFRCKTLAKGEGTLQPTGLWRAIRTYSMILQKSKTKMNRIDHI